jgi:hypothetical protein
MSNKLMLGLWRIMVNVPEPLWQREVARQARGAVDSLGFMTSDHHRVRDFAVRELPRRGIPLSPELIAGALNLPVERTADIVDELERNMTFVYRSRRSDRNRGEAVTWAYPVTVDRTPHHVTFSTGETVYAA